jgi:thymidylate synthase
MANKVDLAYAELVNKILEEGEVIPPSSDRTGLGYINLFGTHLKLDLREGFPLITTKKISYEAIKAELFWFLSGSTNINDLDERYRFIWSPWADSLGDLGPIYPKQLVSWDSYYENENLSTDNPSTTRVRPINQIQEVLENIKSNPHSRRHLISYWNVGELYLMALPPCHFAFCFSVSSDKKFLDLQVFMRSNDIAIGLPYNLAQYATLQHMFGVECGLTPRFLAFSVTNSHIYLPHVNTLKEQIIRPSYDLPILQINKKPFWELRSGDLNLHNYKHGPFTKYQIAV